MKDNTTTLKGGEHGFHLTFPDGFVLSCQYGAFNYCHNQDYGSRPMPSHGELGETPTMEVALMDSKGAFVVLEQDVAGWVPVRLLGSLIAAVEAHDWEHFALLCGELGEPDFSKFPEKGVDYA